MELFETRFFYGIHHPDFKTIKRFLEVWTKVETVPGKPVFKKVWFQVSTVSDNQLTINEGYLSNEDDHGLLDWIQLKLRIERSRGLREIKQKDFEAKRTEINKEYQHEFKSFNLTNTQGFKNTILAIPQS